LKHWLTKAEYAALDEETRASYVADGDEYRLTSDPSENRQLTISLIVLGVLSLSFGLLGVYAIATDRWTVEILAFCGAIPTLFGFLVQLAMRLST